MSRCRNCGFALIRSGNTFYCSKCNYQYKKGEHIAKILQILARNIYGPNTARELQLETDFSISTIKSCLNRLVQQYRVERGTFWKVGVNGRDFKSCPLGKSPRYYYKITPAGMELLQYYKSKGLLKE